MAVRPNEVGLAGLAQSCALSHNLFKPVDVGATDQYAHYFPIGIGRRPRKVHRGLTGQRIQGGWADVPRPQAAHKELLAACVLALPVEVGGHDDPSLHVNQEHLAEPLRPVDQRLES